LTSSPDRLSLRNNIRRRQEEHTVKGIVVTEFLGMVDAYTSATLGASDCVAKPIDLNVSS